MRVSSFAVSCAVVAHVLGFVEAERFWLHRIDRLPEPRTFEVVHYHTIEEGAEVSVLGPVKLEDGAGKKSQEKVEKIQLHMVHAQLMATIEADHFCCSKQDVAEKKCQSDGNLIMTDPGSATGGTRDAVSFSINEETLKNGVNKSWKVPRTGLYFLAISNCGETDFSSTGFASGEISVANVSGYLPAEDGPKKNFYLYLALGYLGLLGAWAAYCWTWTDVLFVIHHFITCALMAGLIEALCWWTSLAHWNWTGHRWWSMIALATLGTTIKQGVCYALLLLACLGMWQICLLTLAFVVTDSYRQFMMAERSAVSADMTTFSTILVVAPGSFFVSCLYVWILQALQETIFQLNHSKQMIKAEIYQSLRLALALVCAVVVAIVAYETVVVRQSDLSTNWDTRWVMFFFLNMVLMYLWRPNETSLQIAYSQQLNEFDDGIELGNRVDVDEEDFKDDMNSEVGDGQSPSRTLE
eukprot:g13149.t1